MAYKYQEILKKIYEVAGTKWVKTPVLYRAKIVKHGDLKLGYILRKRLLERANWCNIPWSEVYFVKAPKDVTRSDKLASWWRITKSGLITLADVFGFDTIIEKDKKIVIKSLLKR